MGKKTRYPEKVKQEVIRLNLEGHMTIRSTVFLQVEPGDILHLL
ncbi:hypothetical protein [Halobacillus sp. B23F22_1]